MVQPGIDARRKRKRDRVERSWVPSRWCGRGQKEGKEGICILYLSFPTTTASSPIPHTTLPPSHRRRRRKPSVAFLYAPTIPPPCSQVSPHEEKGEEKGENKVGEKAFSSPLFLFVRNAAAAAAAAAAATGPRGERAKSGAQGRKEDGLEKKCCLHWARQGGGDTRLIPKSPPLLLLVLVGGWVVVETKGDFQFLRRRDALSRGLGYEAFRTDRPSDHHLPRASAQPSAMPFDFLGKRVQKWTKLDLYLFGP